jgi:ADP-ribosylglycohydrolase
MGHPTEFKSMAQIRADYGPQGVDGFALYWERDGERFAPYTDDTQMAEAVIRGLLEAGLDDMDAAMNAIARRFVKWASDPQGGHRAPGNACLAGCRALAAGRPWSEAGGPKAGGCGSVMRAYPFGLFFADDIEAAEQWAVAHSALTHRDPIARAACAAMAVGVVCGLDDVSVDETLERMGSAAHRHDATTGEMVRRATREAREGVDSEAVFDRLRGWAAHEAIAGAAYTLGRAPDSPRQAILLAANTPGDSDSLATLAGALVCARVGSRDLPDEWVAEIERTATLIELADQVAERFTTAA